MKTKLFILLCLVSLFALLQGCRTVESTSRYYRNLSSAPIAPQPPGVVLPIINSGETRRTYKVIGEMEFETGASDAFIMRAIQYNGTRNGADAIILKTWEKDKETYVEWEPGPGFYAGMRMDYPRHGYRHHHGEPGYYWYGYYDYPHYETYTYITNRVKAEMIVFLDKESFGSIGILFEDVRNSDFLEIGEILPLSAAEKAGLQKGDRVKSIGDYLCNKGIDDYYKNGPVYLVGKEFTVQFERQGLKKTVKVKAEKVQALPVARIETPRH